MLKSGASEGKVENEKIFSTEESKNSSGNIIIMQ